MSVTKIKLYYDSLSQPSRALKLFLLSNKISYEDIPINLAKGEHYDEKFEKINPFKKVPVIEHDGFILTESVAILRYLCHQLELPDHWYPQASIKRAKVDEYMEWQHLNTRLFCAMYFQFKTLRPLLSGQPPDEKMVSYFYKGMQSTLDHLCNVWLKDHKYLCGDTISIADLLGVTELDQPRLAGYDVGEGRPILRAYMERVRADLHPHYDEVMVRFNKFISKYTKTTSLKAKL